jgi:zinc protease
VIIEERRMTIENVPEALLAEEMQAALYRNHPYHTPLIGWMHEMEALSREDVLAFHRQFYHPANAVLVVSGDITRKELQALAEKYYGSLPAGDTYVRHWRSEPPQRAARHVELRHDNVNQPQLIRYYAAPSVNSADKDQVIPLYVLSQILGGGTTSQLYQSLVVTQKIATGVSVDYNGISVGPGQIEISVVPAENVTLPQLETALDKALEAARGETVAADVLARTKTLLKADIIYARDGNENIARILGSVVMSGLPADYFNQWPHVIDAVSAQDVQKAMAAFNPRASVTGYLLPKNSDVAIGHMSNPHAPAAKDIR